MNFSQTLGKGFLSDMDREQIALVVAGFNRCQYCASVHTMLARNAGVTFLPILAS